MGTPAVVRSGGSTTVSKGGAAKVVSSPAPTVVQKLTPSTVKVISGQQGITGPPGPGADFVCIVKPDATLSYIADRLDRVDYADGRYKTLTYTGENLTEVACVDPAAPSTVTKTLTYTGGLLTGVAVAVT